MAYSLPFSSHYLVFNRCFVLFAAEIPIEMLSGHLTFKINERHWFTNIWNELLIRFVIFHISHPYSRTDLTIVLND